MNGALSSTFVAGQTPSTQSELHEQVHRHTHSDPSNQAAWRQIGQREGRLICVLYPSVHQWMALDRLGDVCSLLLILSLEVRQDMEMDHFQVVVSTQALYCPAQ